MFVFQMLIFLKLLSQYSKFQTAISHLIPLLICVIKMGSLIAATDLLLKSILLKSSYNHLFEVIFSSCI